MTSLRFKALTIIAMAVALFLVPVSANAAYTPTAPDGGERTVAPAASFTVTFTGFAPSESVTATLTGPDGANGTLARLKAAVTSTSVTKDADAAGEVPVTVTLPSSSQDGDEYTLLAVGESSGEAVYTIYVVEQASGGGDDDESDDKKAAAGSLTRTDGAITPTVLAIGGVLLLIGLGVVLVARRQRKS